MNVSKKTSNKKKPGFFTLLLLSLVAGAGLTLPTHMLFSNYADNPLSKVPLIMFTSIHSGVLYVIIFQVSSILIRNYSMEHANEKELKNFKDFTDIIHRSASEIEAYQTLYDFIQRMRISNHITLFYRREVSANEVVWERLTKERLPLCTMEPRNCPVVKYGRECLVKNIATDIPCASQLPEHKSGSYICLPITEGDITLGILQLYSKSKNYFVEPLISKVKSYIEVAKPVISSKRVLRQLNKNASTDKLTKLYNRRFLEYYLDNQIEITSFSNQKLSVIMMDIDNFKRINDTYGHTAGDAVLVVFSQVILRCLRQTDLVARYGGEEFMAILPSSDTKNAYDIAERIRESIASEPMPKINNVQLPNISCSFGVSTFPTYADNKNDLIKTADIALYKAKQAGKNRVITYSAGMEM
ncbi:sensor domain-containing diguanylate cyclase [Acetivibrio mesophilus]|jgi:diguanylate cyclase (GGDEF)-like protein|uniref:sensor domain-containing diguanylate cyclase n=1 Tax=Acetivibrio mesophilus TaxID=2487273 RepID=UPI0026ABA536